LKKVNELEEDVKRDSSDKTSVTERCEKVLMIEKRLDEIRDRHSTRIGYKWWALFVTSFSLIAVFWYAIIPSLDFMFIETKSSEVLKDSLKKANLVPENYSIQNILTKDLYITAWDFDHSSPRFFNKISNVKDTDKGFNHDLTLDNMVWASADCPNYFEPAVIDKTHYISGDIVCESPAMYTYLYANEKLDIPTDQLRIVSVGSTLAVSDNMQANSSLL
jgi:predicted acylesterase/phospholipase RssA